MNYRILYIGITENIYIIELTFNNNNSKIWKRTLLSNDIL